MQFSNWNSNFWLGLIRCNSIMLFVESLRVCGCFFLSFVCIYLCVLEMHFNHKNLIWFLCVFVCGLVVVAVVCVVCLLINFFVLFYYFISLIHFLRHTISDCSRFSSLSLFFFSVSLRFSFSLSFLILCSSRLTNNCKKVSTTKFVILVKHLNF